MKNKPLYYLLVLCVIMEQACDTNVRKYQDDMPSMGVLSFINYEFDYCYYRDAWLSGCFLDTSTNIMRNYSEVLSMYNIDSLEFSHVINNLYPRSCAEFKCYYDSLTKSKGDRKIYFKRMDTLFVRYAAFDSAGCFELVLNMTKFIDPRIIDEEYIDELDMAFYYCVIDREKNLFHFKHFFDTCDKGKYYFLLDWVDAYNARVPIWLRPIDQ